MVARPDIRRAMWSFAERKVICVLCDEVWSREDRGRLCADLYRGEQTTFPNRLGTLARRDHLGRRRSFRQRQDTPPCLWRKWHESSWRRQHVNIHGTVAATAPRPCATQTQDRDRS